jgi:hypothetical protein
MQPPIKYGNRKALDDLLTHRGGWALMSGPYDVSDCSVLGFGGIKHGPPTTQTASSGVGTGREQWPSSTSKPERAYGNSRVVIEANECSRRSCGAASGVKLAIKVPNYKKLPLMLGPRSSPGLSPS